MKKIFIWADPDQVNPAAGIDEQFEQSGCNFGNLVISHGAMQLFPSELLAYPKDFKRPEEIAEVCSHVVYPAANILWKGFDMISTYEYLSKVPLPITMLGVGAQINNRNVIHPIHPNTLKLMQFVSERSACIGVRGYYTAEVLASHGIHNTCVLGCPSFYMNLTPSKVRPLESNPLNRLSVNFSRRVNSHSFQPKQLQKLENALLKLALAENAEFIAQDELEEIRLSKGDDKGIASIAKYFDESPPENVETYFANKTRYFGKPQEWIKYITMKSASIGSRFHGNVIALISGTPALFFIHDSRTMELCSLLGAPSIHVDDIKESQFTVDYIKERFLSADYSLFEKAHSCLFDKMKDFLKQSNLYNLSKFSN